MRGKLKRDIVQTKNPRSHRYVKFDRSIGRIISEKKSRGPYKGVPVARKMIRKAIRLVSWLPERGRVDQPGTRR